MRVEISPEELVLRIGEKQLVIDTQREYIGQLEAANAALEARILTLTSEQSDTPEDPQPEPGPDASS